MRRRERVYVASTGDGRVLELEYPSLSLVSGARSSRWLTVSAAIRRSAAAAADVHSVSWALIVYLLRQEAGVSSNAPCQLL